MRTRWDQGVLGWLNSEKSECELNVSEGFWVRVGIGLESLLEFCGYTMLNTFAPQKSVFIDFLDNAWEWNLLTTLIVNFQVKATFTPHLDT